MVSRIEMHISAAYNEIISVKERRSSKASLTGLI
jgi:hypothetical protein